MCPLNIEIHLSSTFTHQAIPEKNNTGKDSIHQYQQQLQLSSCLDGKKLGLETLKLPMEEILLSVQL